MAELINIITKKHDWKVKINDVNIIKKWENELKDFSVNPNILDLVIQLLKQYILVDSNEYIYQEKYQWVINLDIDTTQVSIAEECECKCKICQGCENDSGTDSDDESENENEGDDEFDDNCQCTYVRLEKKKSDFLDNNLSISYKLIDDYTKKSLIKYVKEYQSKIPIDYHPGTNDTVVDIVHPSLYCYVKGITKTNIKVDDSIIFQWLPSEFSVKNGRVFINSYINNLDPLTNVELYVTIAKIFEKFVPKFDSVLKILYDSGRTKNFDPLSNCQVIVKLANTELTPENPYFEKGSWHLEGLPYEKIIATGIYYYSMQNITDNYLNFRGTMDTCKINYPQDCREYVEKHYDFGTGNANSDNNMGSTINLGRIKTIEDMCLVFPNFMQHQVSSFTLNNKYINGSRKTLVFFLIDPSTPILSTANVKPQQNKMSLEDAKLFRELLMFQRKYQISDQNSFYERGWSLCEH